MFALKYYEPGRHDRSWKWVWKYRVEPEYHISFSTFKKYLKMYVRKQTDFCNFAENFKK